MTETLDDLARLSASPVSRRRFLRVAVGAMVVSALPRWVLRTERAQAGVIGMRGYCPTAGSFPGCPENTVEIPWTTICGTPADYESYVFPSGAKATYNGCGPEKGIDLKVLGKHEPPDKPLALGDFAEACNKHDCCYGTCGTPKSQCDKEFIEGMSGACRQNPANLLSGIGLIYCEEIAAVYFAFVAGGGADAYEEAQRQACKCCKEPCADCDQRIANGEGYMACCGANFQCVDTRSDKQNCGECDNVCADHFGYNASVNQTAICCDGNCTPQGCGCGCVSPAECCVTVEAGQFVCCPNGCHEGALGYHCV